MMNYLQKIVGMGRFRTSFMFDALGFALLVAELTSAAPWEPSVDDMSYSQWVGDAHRNPCGGRETIVLLLAVFLVLRGFRDYGQ